MYLQHVAAVDYILMLTSPKKVLNKISPINILGMNGIYKAQEDFDGEKDTDNLGN